MEFEFRKNFVSGNATVKLSMGHEAFATWLEFEGQSVFWVENLLSKIDLLKKRDLTDFKLPGREFSLILTQDEAEVFNHSTLNNQDGTGLEVGMDFYDLEIQAACGLEDFSNLIESWLEFIKS